MSHRQCVCVATESFSGGWVCLPLDNIYKTFYMEIFGFLSALLLIWGKSRRRRSGVMFTTVFE